MNIVDKMTTTSALAVLVVLAALAWSGGGATVHATTSPSSTSTCETIETELMLSREKVTEYYGRARKLLCYGTIKINKCEGMCESQVQPSVVQHTGFKKTCKCCSEGGLKNRLVQLQACYDGNRLIPDQHVVYMVNEPTECACRDCTI